MGELGDTLKQTFITPWDKPMDWVTGDYQRNADQEFQREMWEKNYNMQKEFAKMGVQWKIENAKEAGIHPLAALGAQTKSASPISVTGGSGASGASFVMGLINTISQMAQANRATAMQGQQTASDRIGTGRVQSVPVTQEMLNADNGAVRAGIHADLTWMPKAGGGLQLTAGPNAVGVEEDPGKVIRLQKFINYDLPKSSDRYFQMKRRKGPGWRKFKRTIIDIFPASAPGKNRTWQWSFQQRTFVRRPSGAPLFENTTGIKQSPARYY